MATIESTRPRTRRAPSPQLLTGLSGLVLIATTLFATLPEPDDGAAPESLRAFYENHFAATGLAVLMGTLAMAAFLAFLLGVRHLVAEAGAGDTLVDAVRVSGTLVTIWFWMGAAVGGMVLVMAEDGSLSQYDDTALSTLDLFSRLAETFGDVGMLAIGMFVLSVSVAAIRTRFVPRWTGHLGLVVTAGCAISLFLPVWEESVLVIGFFVGLFGFVFWTLVVSVALCVRGARRG